MSHWCVPNHETETNVITNKVPHWSRLGSASFPPAQSLQNAIATTNKISNNTAEWMKILCDFNEWSHPDSRNRRRER